jgi:hypothetical protein
LLENPFAPLPKCLEGMLSRGLLHIGYDRVLELIVTQLKGRVEGGKLVGIGSGNALLECVISERLGMTPDLIDPNPYSFANPEKSQFGVAPEKVLMGDVYRMPEYASAAEYKKKVIDGHDCIVDVLVINWPEPCGEVRTNPYELEAIQLLRPRFVVTVLDGTGGSGSEAYREFLLEASNKCKGFSPEYFTGEFERFANPTAVSASASASAAANYTTTSALHRKDYPKRIVFPNDQLRLLCLVCEAEGSQPQPGKFTELPPVARENPKSTPEFDEFLGMMTQLMKR